MSVKIIRKEQLFHILDTRQVVGNCAMWWRPNGQGYTCDLNDAGKYTRSEVSARTQRDTDIPICCEDARKFAVLHARIDVLRQNGLVDERDRTQTCANCGESWGSAESHIGIGEGEWCCSAWCEECHEDEGCPLEIGEDEVELRRERRMDREFGLTDRKDR